MGPRIREDKGGGDGYAKGTAFRMTWWAAKEGRFANRPYGGLRWL